MENIRNSTVLRLLLFSMAKQISYWQASFELLVSSWWLILFLLISGFIYDRAIVQLTQETTRLQNRVTDLQLQIQTAQIKRTEMQSHLKAWNSSEVLEYALIHRLGLIPKGFAKVCFIPPSSSCCTEGPVK